MNHQLDQYDKDEQMMIIQGMENRGEKSIEEVLAEVAHQTLPKFREILKATGFNINDSTHDETASG